MRIAIVGLPYCGKSSTFSALSGIARDQLQPAGENVAAVRVPEPRLDALEEMFKPKKRTEANLEFVDLPSAADSDGGRAGFEKQIPTLRQVDALLVVLRAFESPAVPNPPGGLNPAADLQNVREEMLLADMVICDNRCERLEAAIKKPTPQREQQKKELELIQRCKAALEEEQPLIDIIQAGEEEKMLRSFGFLTQKPLIAVLNIGEEQVSDPPTVEDPHGTPIIPLCAELEAELAQLDPPDRAEMMQGYGLEQLRADDVVRGCFDGLGLLFFLTAGEQEVRAWPLPRDSSAVDAAGKIHSDIARGFIRAETVAFEDLVNAGSMRDAKAAGKVRQEPKAYIIQDGDVILFKFNV